MALLKDYAITPDVFDFSCSSKETCGLQLQVIQQVLIPGGLIRDLRSGDWSRLLETDKRSWHFRTKKLLEVLQKNHRLVRYNPTLDNAPTDDLEWCREALGTGEQKPFSGGVIVTDHIKKKYPREKQVSKIEGLPSTGWWPNPENDDSVRVSRCIEDYKMHLDPILRHANSIMFIDPYLDPKKYQYRNFEQLLTYIAEIRDPKSELPLIEIHRASREEGRDWSTNYFRQRFLQKLQEPLQRSELKVEVFIWEHFHDRHLISDMVGIELQNGFDTSENPEDKTTWSRMGTDDRDDVQGDFDPDVNNLHGSFTIP